MFNNRVQFIEIENTDFTTGQIRNFRSDKATLRGSIPQGSVLGCILFLIYINDLPNVIEEHSALFADDVSVLFSCSDKKEAESKLNLAMQKIVKWLDFHNLQLNLEKTKVIQFKPYQKSPLPIIFNYNNITLESVNSATVLGIDLDANMNWKPHIERLSKKLSSFIYALQHLKRASDFQTALSVYYAYAYSRMTYGLVLWGNSSELQKIFILQKKCIRILTNIDQMESCKPHFRELNILTLPSMYIFESCKFVRNHINLFTPTTGKIKRNNRNLNKLQLPFSKLKIVTSSPPYMVIKIYNHLPNSIRNIEKLSLFKKLLKTFLINKSYYNLHEYFNDKHNE